MITITFPSNLFYTLFTFFSMFGFVENGGQAKEVIQDGFVSVNGEVETRRGRKLYPNDVVSYEENELTVKQ